MERQTNKVRWYNLLNKLAEIVFSKINQLINYSETDKKKRGHSSEEQWGALERQPKFRTW